MKTLNRLRVLLVVAGWMLAQLRAEAAETNLIAFELDAHDGKSYTERTWAGRPLVMFITTREGAAHNEGRVWSQPLADAFSAHPGNVMMIGVADLHSVPRLFRGMLRDMARELTTPTDDDPLRIRLIDWEGEFARPYELADDAYNMLVFDRRGQLVYSAAMYTFEQAQLDSVLRELQPIIDAF